MLQVTQPVRPLTISLVGHMLQVTQPVRPFTISLVGHMLQVTQPVRPLTISLVGHTILQVTQPVHPPITSLVRHHAANNSHLSTHRLSLVRHNASSNRQFVHLSSHLSDTSHRDGLVQAAVDQRQLGSSQPAPETNTSWNANWSLHASKQTWTALAISSEVRVNWITGHGKGIIVLGSKNTVHNENVQKAWPR